MLSAGVTKTRGEKQVAVRLSHHISNLHAVRTKVHSEWFLYFQVQFMLVAVFKDAISSGVVFMLVWAVLDRLSRYR